jgi:hypothetical protein
VLVAAIEPLIFFEKELEPGNKVLILFAAFSLKHRHVVWYV